MQRKRISISTLQFKPNFLPHVYWSKIVRSIRNCHYSIKKSMTVLLESDDVENNKEKRQVKLPMSNVKIGKMKWISRLIIGHTKHKNGHYKSRGRTVICKYCFKSPFIKKQNKKFLKGVSNDSICKNPTEIVKQTWETLKGRFLLPKHFSPLSSYWKS